jgi:hypothetical protein
MKWTIKVAFRTAHSREEKRLMGRCISEGHKASVFLNADQKPHELFNTYIHELTHSYLHRLKVNPKDSAEEEICRAVGDAAEAAFNKYFALNK